MKVVVFGATGKTGELTWRKAVEAGHDVTVFGRSVERRYANEPWQKCKAMFSTPRQFPGPLPVRMSCWSALAPSAPKTGQH